MKCTCTYIMIKLTLVFISTAFSSLLSYPSIQYLEKKAHPRQSECSRNLEQALP